MTNQSTNRSEINLEQSAEKFRTDLQAWAEADRQRTERIKAGVKRPADADDKADFIRAIAMLLFIFMMGVTVTTCCVGALAYASLYGFGIVSYVLLGVGVATALMGLLVSVYVSFEVRGV